MGQPVYEIMNREVFRVAPDVKATDALARLLSLRISGAPVVDGDDDVVGVVSLRDLAGRSDAARVLDCLSRPAPVTIRWDATVDDAARVMCQAGVHRLIVLGPDRRLAGVVSTLDLLRAIVGLPVVHPPAFAGVPPRGDELVSDEPRPDDLRPDDLRPDDLRPDDLRPDDLRPEGFRTGERVQDAPRRAGSGGEGRGGGAFPEDGDQAKRDAFGL